MVSIESGTIDSFKSNEVRRFSLGIDLYIESNYFYCWKPIELPCSFNFFYLFNNFCAATETKIDPEIECQSLIDLAWKLFGIKPSLTSTHVENTERDEIDENSNRNRNHLSIVCPMAKKHSILLEIWQIW